MSKQLDPNIEVDPRLADVPLKSKYDLYASQYEGFEYCDVLAERHSDKATAKALRKAARYGLADICLIATAVQDQKKARKGTWKPSLADDEIDSLRSDGYSKKELLMDIRSRLEGGWEGVPDALKERVLRDLAMLKSNEESGPDWSDLLTLMSELETINQNNPVYCQASDYSALLERTGDEIPEGNLGSAPNSPGEGDQVYPYSPKASFDEGQWVDHPTFGVGSVVEANQYIVVAFEGGPKRLAHTRARPAAPGVESKKKQTSSIDVVAAARAQGIEIKVVPPVPDDD